LPYVSLLSQRWTDRLSAAALLIMALGFAGCPWSAAGRVSDLAPETLELAAIESPAPETPLQARHAGPADRQEPLPDEAVRLSSDPDPRVRAAALALLVKQRHPDAQRHLIAALEDQEFQVRAAAVAGLGELGGAEARATLKKLLADRSEMTRAEAVAALARLGAEEDVLGAAKDKSWRARSAVAAALARYPDRNAAAVAGDLLDDPSPMVQEKVVRSVADWPLPQSGPILLAAMGKSVVMTRRTAARLLANRWPPAAGFPVDALADRRNEALEQLKWQFREQIGFSQPGSNAAGQATALAAAIPAETAAQVEQWVKQLSDPGVAADGRQQAVRELAGLGPELTAALEQLALDRQQGLPEAVYREVLPGVSPAFAALDRMTSPDAAVRRRAAAELADLAGQRPLGRLAVERLASVAAREADALVWQSVLGAVAGDPGDAAARLAYAAVGHSSPEVRRRACEHLAAHPDPKHVPVLVPTLHDSSEVVVQAAVRAIGAAGRMEDARPVRQLLTAANEPLRLEAAKALVRLGDASGAPALERLAYSSEPAIRQQAAVAMGETADPTFVPPLVQLLDDRHNVRRAALEALPKVVGRDVAGADGRPPADLAERADLWKRWFREERAVGGRP